jgi:16S rRNA C967 or C1407 C5-methylase (RsmB/RsmF family)
VILPNFDEYYKAIFGSRWPGLLNALQGEAHYETLRFGDCEPYFLDGASLWAARALRPTPGSKVLDMCAAPGGKSLALAAALAGHGSLLCNELSEPRRARLRRVLDTALPPEWRRAVSVGGRDASRFGMREPASYDFVLLDAPCSSERHLLESARHMEEWTPGRSKNLSKRQVGLIASATDALAPGGTLVYSTCALNPQENDGVVRTLLKKRKEMRAQPLDAHEAPPGADRTEFGIHILPDRCEGMGPIYYARMEKLPSFLPEPVLRAVP